MVSMTGTVEEGWGLKEQEKDSEEAEGMESGGVHGDGAAHSIVITHTTHTSLTHTHTHGWSERGWWDHT
jgi:hypothetical protein